MIVRMSIDAHWQAEAYPKGTRGLAREEERERERKGDSAETPQGRHALLFERPVIIRPFLPQSRKSKDVSQLLSCFLSPLPRSDMRNCNSLGIIIVLAVDKSKR